MYDIYVNSQFLKTPKGNPIEVPTLDLAREIEEEWVKDNSPHYLKKPLTSLVATALDLIADDRDLYVNEIIQSISTDTLLYWASTPESLCKLQEKKWKPLLEEVSHCLEISLKPTSTFSVPSLLPQDVEKVKIYLHHQSAFVLAGFVHLIQLIHSFSLAYLIFEDKLPADQAWDFAHLHEDEQSRIWGKDEEILIKEQAEYKDFQETVRFLKLTNR